MYSSTWPQNAEHQECNLELIGKHLDSNRTELDSANSEGRRPVEVSIITTCVHSLAAAPHISHQRTPTLSRCCAMSMHSAPLDKQVALQKLQSCVGLARLEQPGRKHYREIHEMTAEATLRSILHKLPVAAANRHMNPRQHGGRLQQAREAVQLLASSPTWAAWLEPRRSRLLQLFALSPPPLQQTSTSAHVSTLSRTCKDGRTQCSAWLSLTLLTRARVDAHGRRRLRMRRVAWPSILLMGKHLLSRLPWVRLTRTQQLCWPRQYRVRLS